MVSADIHGFQVSLEGEGGRRGRKYLNDLLFKKGPKKRKSSRIGYCEAESGMIIEVPGVVRSARWMACITA